MDPYSGTFTATSYGPACPQQAFDFPELSGLAGDTVDFIVNSIYQVISPAAEDCELVKLHCLSICPLTTFQGLSINVIVPTGTKPDAKLPVAVVSAPFSRLHMPES